jgi:hypothetical protein
MLLHNGSNKLSYNVTGDCVLLLPIELQIVPYQAASPNRATEQLCVQTVECFGHFRHSFNSFSTTLRNAPELQKTKQTSNSDTSNRLQALN